MAVGPEIIVAGLYGPFLASSALYMSLDRLGRGSELLRWLCAAAQWALSLSLFVAMAFFWIAAGRAIASAISVIAFVCMVAIGPRIAVDIWHRRELPGDPAQRSTLYDSVLALFANFVVTAGLVILQPNAGALLISFFIVVAMACALKECLFLLDYVVARSFPPGSDGAGEGGKVRSRLRPSTSPFALILRDVWKSSLLAMMFLGTSMYLLNTLDGRSFAGAPADFSAFIHHALTQMVGGSSVLSPASALAQLLSGVASLIGLYVIGVVLANLLARFLSAAAPR